MKAFTFAIALVGIVAAAQADLRAEIQASNNLITSAMKKKDFATLDRVMKSAITSDFKYVEAGKSQSYDEMFGNMKAGLGMMKSLSVCKTKLLTLKQKGNNASGTVEHMMVGTTAGPDKKNHTMSFSGVSEDTYRKEGGKWKLASMTWKSQKGTMDGKPMPGMGH